MSGRRRALFAVLTPVMAVGAVLLAVELALRLGGYDPFGRVGAGRGSFLRSASHPHLEYDLAPGMQGVQWGTSVRINSHGFRDAEYALAKPPGTRRVIVLGDSVTFGNHLAVEDTFPERLEAEYAAAGRRVEVLNLGVGGYDTLQEVAFLERTGLRFDPDVVVVGYCINDTGRVSVNRELIAAMESYGALVRRSRLLQFLMVRMDRLEAEWEARARTIETEQMFRESNPDTVLPLDDDPEAMARIARLRSELERSDAPALPFLAWHASEARIGKLRFAFRRLGQLGREHGFAVVVLVIPFLDESAHPQAYRLAYEIVGHEAARAGFHVVDAAEAFRAAGPERLITTSGGLRDPMHPNVEGHRILARLLQSELDRFLD